MVDATENPEVVDPHKVTQFWDQVADQAPADAESGYLQDEYPPAIALNRFRGELRSVKRWLREWEVPTGRCLDFGCGTGLWLSEFAKRFEHCDGYDSSTKMAEIARNRVAKLGLSNVTILHEGLETISATGLRYDFIFVGGVLMYLPDEVARQTLGALTELLSPKGLLLLREPVSQKSWFRSKPLVPGLFAKESLPRPPYFATYRAFTDYEQWARDLSLLVKNSINPHYSVADLTETWILGLNRITFGWLARSPHLANFVAKALHAFRWWGVRLVWQAIRMFKPWFWRVQNRWYLLRLP